MGTPNIFSKNLKLPCSREPTTLTATSSGKQSEISLSTVDEAVLQYNADCLPPEVATKVVVTIPQGCLSCLIFKLLINLEFYVYLL